MIKATRSANEIRGTDAIGNLATNAMIRRLGMPAAKLDEESKGCLRRNKIDPDATPKDGFTLPLLDQAGFESRAQSILKGSGGGFVIPQGFIRGWEYARDALSLLRLATTERLESGREYRVPMIDDRAGNGIGRLVTENTASQTADASWTQRVVEFFKFTSGSLLVPSELAEDSPRFPEQLGYLAGLRVYRAVNWYGINGTGVSQPAGLLQESNHVSAGSSSAIAGDDLNNLTYSIADGRYDGPQPPVFMCSLPVLKIISGLKDGSGRYLFNSDERKIFGFGVVLNSAMPTSIASGTVSVLFGDSSAVLISEIASVRLDAFAETHAETDQVLWRATGRACISLLDSGDHPISGLQH